MISTDARMRLVAVVKLLTLSGAVVLLMTMCATTNPDLSDAHRAMQSENYIEAKMHLKRVIRAQAQSAFKGERIEALRMLSFAHGHLGEYDSMGIVLESLVILDPNQIKQARLTRETFAVKEFNSAVNLFNLFFYEKALVQFRTSIQIVGKLPPYQEFSAFVLRNMAYTCAGMDRKDEAVLYLREAQTLGDWLSKSVLELLEKEQKIEKPEKLDAYPKSQITET